MPDVQVLRSHILDLNARWNAAFNAGRAAEVAAFYEAGATVMPAGGPAATGTAAIQQFWQSLFDQGVTDHDITLSEVGEDGNLAYQRGRWSAAATDGGGHRQTFGGHLQLLYCRQPDGSWKVRTHIWN